MSANWEFAVEPTTSGFCMHARREVMSGDCVELFSLSVKDETALAEKVPVFRAAVESMEIVLNGGPTIEELIQYVHYMPHSRAQDDLIARHDSARSKIEKV